MMQPRWTTKNNSSSVPKQGQQGFTFIEVLAGIIVSTIFVLVTAEATFVSVVLRVQAQRASEAMNAIQSDFDEIKYEAALSFSNASPDCDATTPEKGYAQALINQIKAPDPPTLVNKEYNMNRNLSIPDQPPYNIVEVSYRVEDPDSGRIVAEYYSEIIPDAFFACRN
ncbi:hypothetical protein AWQ21_08260 [Picosynechococcus sp. PCC 7003]|uniref:type IV pilus modification PilV family protein n=1 Tax=Picosynechococcus sp. PCC 7003 TaxID=374981 RepID=UPI00081092CE|nr:type II secretion system protein [Picosynechococcus sp. PCC 7003]ANV84375.1 hypothetical protein AWQ21_08260 [Picosynechococcus sp. PCC 7003]